MALVPSVPSLWRDWWIDFDRPCRLLDVNFRRALRRADLLDPLILPSWDSYFYPWNRLIEHRVTVSTTTTTTTLPEPEPEPKYTIVLDVNQFSAHEIIVKTTGRSIIIEAKHEERRCCGSYTTTELRRRYELPKEYSIYGVLASLSTDGVLTITAPRVPPPPPRETIVPVNRLCCRAIKN